MEEEGIGVGGLRAGGAEGEDGGGGAGGAGGEVDGGAGPSVRRPGGDHLGRAVVFHAEAEAGVAIGGPSAEAVVGGRGEADDFLLDARAGSAGGDLPGELAVAGGGGGDGRAAVGAAPREGLVVLEVAVGNRGGAAEQEIVSVAGGADVGGVGEDGGAAVVRSGGEGNGGLGVSAGAQGLAGLGSAVVLGGDEEAGRGGAGIAPGGEDVGGVGQQAADGLLDRRAAGGGGDPGGGGITAAIGGGPCGLSGGTERADLALEVAIHHGLGTAIDSDVVDLHLRGGGGERAIARGGNRSCPSGAGVVDLAAQDDEFAALGDG